jgi:hypothetical protein
MSAHRDLGGPLAVHLVDIASDRGPDTTSDDLSTPVVRSSERFGLEMWRRGYAAAIADIRASHDAGFDDAPTQRIPRPAQSEDETPVRPISVADMKASRS